MKPQLACLVSMFLLLSLLGSVNGIPVTAKDNDLYTGNKFLTNENVALNQGQILSVAGYNGLNNGVISNNNVNSLLYKIFLPYITQEYNNTTLSVLNLSTTADAHIQMYYYNPDGSLADMAPGYTNPDSDTVLVRGLNTYSPVHAIDGFKGSIVITSDQLITAVITIKKLGSNRFLNYTGQYDGSPEITLPRIMRNWNGWNTEFWVQNTGDTSADITINYKPLDGGNAYVLSDTIFAGASHSFRQSDQTQLGPNFSGTVKITCTDYLHDSVASVVVETDSTSEKGGAYNGFISANSTLWMTRQQKNVDGWSSSTHFMNMGNIAYTTTVSFYDYDGSFVWSDSALVLPRNTLTYNLDNISNLPNGFDGSILVTSGPMNGYTALHRSGLPGADTYATFQGELVNQVTNSILLPRIIHHQSQGSSTQISISNVGTSSTNAIVSFFSTTGDITDVITQTIPSHGTQHISTVNIIDLGTEWEGYAIASSNQAIIGVAVQIKQTNTTYTISGNISGLYNEPILGVMITYGPELSTTTDSFGNYIISDLITGTYTLQPSKVEYSFFPPSRLLVVPPNAIGQDFRGWIGLIIPIYMPIIMRGS